MQLDPTRWLVNLAGFSSDWMLTREWKSIFLSLIPAIGFGAVGTMVWIGATQDPRSLAQWYIELGDEEIADWEDSWAPGGSESDGNMGNSVGETNGDAGEGKDEGQQLASVQGVDDTKEVSRFAEVLFRRVQMLEPSNRSQFVVGATLAQRGAVGQAKTILAKVAPDDQSGYAPAHAFLTLIYLQEFRMRQSAELVPLIKHHSEMAAKWDRAPEQVLLAGSDVHWATEDRSTSIKLLEQAAERNPALFAEVAKRAFSSNNKLLYSRSRERAEKHLREAIDSNPKDDDARTRLAELLLADRDGVKNAQELIAEGLQIEQTTRLLRAMSELYRKQFLDTLQKSGDNKYNANMNLLEQAMRIDPTNPRVPEVVALLARAGGVAATDALIANLQEFLASGQATVMTHAWLAEAYLTRNNYAKAIPHLEQVVQKLPNADKYLNNLAYVLAELEPDRMEEALGYAQRATLVSRRSKTPNPDFFDTLGTIEMKLGHHKESIAAFETAIQLSPMRIDFHERIMEPQRAIGEDALAEAHERVIEKIKLANLEKAKQEAESKRLEKATQSNSSSNVSEQAADAGAGNESSVLPDNGNPSEEPTEAANTSGPGR